MAKKTEREGRQVLARRPATGVVRAGVVLAGVVLAGVVSVQAGPAAAGSQRPDARALYRQTIATTKAWSVHYASTSTQSKTTLRLSGDAGPASGSQHVVLGNGSISIVVIGGITYLQGDASGLQRLAGFSTAQAVTAAGQWMEFATTNASFAPVVAGVRSHDVAKELALGGQLSLGRPRRLGGRAVEAIEGTQKIGHRTVHAVLYVRAHGTHVPVEEDSVNAKGRHTAIEHVTYSRWGEQIRPRAAQPTISIGPVSSA